MSRLASTVNEIAGRLYQSPPTDDDEILCRRVRMLAADRDAWVSTAKALQAAYNDLDRRNSSSSREPSTLAPLP
jgi:hypothetical protein